MGRHVEEFVKWIKQNQFQIELGMKLGTNDAHSADSSYQLTIQDVFAVKQFWEQNLEEKRQLDENLGYISSQIV